MLELRTTAGAAATESPKPGLLEVIPNGVAIPDGNDRPRVRRPDEPIRFGTLGTVKPIKGTDLLVDAFMRFEPERRVELVIAGLIDRPWAEALRERARGDARVQFVGRSSAPRDFLAGLDVFVLPSRSEGMSNALLEAMASGLPCIATDVGSNRSVLCPVPGSPGGLIADATVNTDFAQVEEDLQQINLTRFTLQFPEKRDFFLKEADIFEFGRIGTANNMFGVMRPARENGRPFFSRRIGLSDTGQIVEQRL